VQLVANSSSSPEQALLAPAAISVCLPLMVRLRAEMCKLQQALVLASLRSLAAVLGVP
jgi:hypothetical protein